MCLSHDNEVAFVASEGEKRIIFSTQEAVQSLPAEKDVVRPTKGGCLSASSSPSCGTVGTATPTASDSVSISIQEDDVSTTPGSSACSPSASLCSIEPTSPTDPPDEEEGMPALQGEVEKAGADSGAAAEAKGEEAFSTAWRRTDARTWIVTLEKRGRK